MCGIGIVFRTRHNAVHACACEARNESDGILEDARPFGQRFGDFEAFLLDRLSHRGPDSIRQVECELFDASGEVTSNVTVISSVLNMRNQAIVQQPIVDENFILQWNGEIYPYSRQSSDASYACHDSSGPSAGPPPPLGSSDTLWVHRHIERIVGANLHSPKSKLDAASPLDANAQMCIAEKITHQIRDFFENPQIKGAYAFAVIIPRLSLIIYGRDKVGRRSLVRLMCEVTHGHHQSRKFLLGLCSTGYAIHQTLPDGTRIHISTEDVSVEGVHCLQLTSNGTHTELAHTGGVISSVAEWTRPFLRMHPLTSIPHASTEKCRMEMEAFFENRGSPLWEQLPVQSFTHHGARDTPMRETRWYLHALYDAVAERILTAPVSAAGSGESHVGLLFSGGVDSMLLAALIHWAIKIEFPAAASRHFVVELLNVSFGELPERSPDRISARRGLAELCAAFPDRVFRLVLIDASDVTLLKRVQSECSDGIDQRIRSLVLPSDTVMDLNIATALWFAAAGVGAIARPSDTQSAIVPCRFHRTAAVDDDTFTANVEPIADPPESCFAELTNALTAEYAANDSHVRKLPISVFGNAPYSIPYKKYGFAKLVQYMRAAQSAGLCRLTTDAQKNHSIEPVIDVQQSLVREAPQGDSSSVPLVRARARLLFSGLGADETLAGYRRHRTAFHSTRDAEKPPLQRLLHELDFDCGNLWRRNCGRDDRVVSDHGKELALPFLDEKVIGCIQAISSPYGMESDGVHAKTEALWDLCQRDGIGDKKLVRTAARLAGLSESSTLVKRAIQFGSRIAVRKVKGEQKI
ncbi:hypothetical protein XU18_0521 [Perkinsela sp. CCAP 1560/4]|nr:hypothetical protein XU18_0521 [Perkinsela sp. CCAP 1560/4]|eukprot:KNH09243.1 hypothetical protein XU18_0521 [Perkinsela sp. CCAP 1560/4]